MEVVPMLCDPIEMLQNLKLIPRKQWTLGRVEAREYITSR